MSSEIRKRVKTRLGLFFMSFETRKRIKTLLGLFFTNLEMGERVGAGDSLFREFENKRTH